MSKRDAYIELVLMAAFVEETAENGGEAIPLHRGQVLVSERDLMERFRWGNTKVRNFLAWLEKEDIATIDKAVCKAGSKAVRKAVLTLKNYGIETYRKAVNKAVDKAVDKAVFKNERKEPKESKKNTLSDATHPSEYLEIKNNTVSGLAAEFDEFWKDYPRKVSKQDAYKSYCRARETTPKDVIFAGLDRYKRFLREEQTEYNFIAHATTWLNQHRWEDEYPVATTAPVQKTQFHNFEERHTDYDALFGKKRA